MILEFLRSRSFLILAFAIGASLIIGFLSFSGMYVLLPLLPLAIAAFVLSIAYEGEIYLQNIRGAFDKLFNPNYYKEQLAKECLRELLPHEEERRRALFENQFAIEKIRTLLTELETSGLFAFPNANQKQQYKIIIEALQDNAPEIAENFPTIENFYKYPISKLKKTISVSYQNLIDNTPFFDDFLHLLRIYHQYDEPNLRGYTLERMSSYRKTSLNKRILHLSQKKGEIFYSLVSPNGQEIYQQSTGIKAPKPFTLKKLNQIKAQILTVAQRNGHAHADDGDNKERLKKSLQTLEQVFIDQLFETPNAPKEHHLPHTKQYIDSLHQFFDKNFALAELSEEEFIALKQDLKNHQKTKLLKLATKENYKTILFSQEDVQNLRTALPQTSEHLGQKFIDTPFREIWETKLKKRRRAFRMTQALSSIAALFMMLGTSFLLVEAFSVFPFMAAISFSIWPAFIVPMAIVAGFAFGLLTFNAITDMINDDIILERYRKLKEDWHKGLTFKSGLMLVTTMSLFVLTIALTVCTAGTWWTVIKHTRPIFAFMRKIPVVVVGLAAAVLGIATFAFSVGNTLDTLKELDEEAGDHPYDLALMDLDEGASLPDPQALQKPTLVKQGKQYWVVGSLDGKTWQIKQLFPNGVFDYIDFGKAYLRFSPRQSFTYLIIWLYSAHRFIPNSKNWRQKANPFRFILITTYTPLRIILFLGHLISIGVMADRLPGIPEILSALFGIISEFFEDWHYFFSFKHAHHDDIQSLYDEYHEKEGGHDHTDDLPTRILRQLFYPIIYMAAWWDNVFSNAREDLPPLRKYASHWVWVQDKDERALSFENALDEYRGLSAQAEITLDKDDSTYIQIAQRMPELAETSVGDSTEPVAKIIALEAQSEQSFLVDNLATLAYEEKDSTQKHLTYFSMFKKCACPASHQAREYIPSMAQ